MYRLKFSVKWQVLKLTSMFLLFPGRCPSIQLFIHLYTLPLHIVFFILCSSCDHCSIVPPWKEYKKCSDCFHFKRKQNVYLLFSCPFTFVFWRNFPTIYTFCGRCFWFIRFLCFCFLFFFGIFIRFGWCCSLTFLLVLFCIINIVYSTISCWCSLSLAPFTQTTHSLFKHYTHTYVHV